jgi:3-methyladenine DNA glycosylase AlkD
LRLKLTLNNENKPNKKIKKYMHEIIDKIRNELVQNSDENTHNSAQRFFKEKIKLYGIKNATVHKIAKRYFEMIKEKPKSTIFELCEILMQSGFIEESFIACDWSYSINKYYEHYDFHIFERWINNYVNNWATCDTLCNHTLGEFLMKFPEYAVNLENFAKSENRWVRRAAAVSLIIPAKKGHFLNETFVIATILIHDKDDLVQKGYGWMLKAASESHQKEVFDFVIKNKNAMPRTTLRYAIEKMPKELKNFAMIKN